MNSIQTGEWLTRERTLRIAVIAGLVSVAILFYLLTGLLADR